MARIRRDLRGEAVLISPGRAGRPYDFRSTAAERRSRCPFCPGRESDTPPEVDAVRPSDSGPDGPGWRVRVVPNLFPAYPREPEPSETAETEEAAFGVHEVIIETPDHERCLADLTAKELTPVLEVWQRRLRAAREDSRIRYACLFKNRGAGAGASLEHSHSQLMATPFVPQRILGELEAAGQGELSARIEVELSSDRVVWSDDRVAAFAPADARFPYELWLVPRSSEASFEDASAQVIAAAASALQSLLPALGGLRSEDDPPYHLMVYTAPFKEPGRASYWWRIELFPRLAQVAGFELATGVFVNQKDPGAAAEEWRAALAADG